MRIFLFLLIWPFLSAQCATELFLTEVHVECQESEICSARKLRFNNLIGNYRSLVHLKETIKIVSSDGGYESLNYQLYRMNKNYKLLVWMRIKPVIKEINIGTIDRNLDADPAKLLLVKEGEFFEEQNLKDDLINLKSKLDSMGYPQNSQKMILKRKKDKVFIDILIELGHPRIFKGIKSNSRSSFVKEFLKRKFLSFYNKPFELTKFKLYLDDAQKELFNYGYYLLNLDMKPIYKNDRVVLDIMVNQERLFAFDFKNLKEESRDKILELVKDLFRKYKRPLPEGVIKLGLEEHFKLRGLLNTYIKITTEKSKNRYQETMTVYKIFFQENAKTNLKEVNFSGNNFFSSDQLQRMFDQQAFELAKVGYYDSAYFDYFADFIKTKYIENGYVQVKISGPNTTFSEGKTDATIDYQIFEGPRTFIRDLTFSEIKPELEEEILSKLSNIKGKYFNPISLNEDLKKVTSFLQESGYYFAEILNSNESSFVTYSQTGSDVDINYRLSLGPLVKLNRIIFLGNTKTRKRVLEKKIRIEPGEIITPNKTKNFENILSATGLFNTVTISPVRHSSQVSSATDLIVRVSERDYGLIELAPGYRTDLGLKLTGIVSYVNIGGENIAITLRSQVNQRLDFETLDPVRRADAVPLLEHNTALTYSQGDIFDTLIDFSATGSYQRKRFYPFDADIARGNVTFSRDLSKRLSTSTRYQIETISQFNATEERDNGSFRIGAITPSLTFDLRNNPIVPVSGALLNLSCEFANPFFGSQKESDLTINYYKLVTRNRFYIPHQFGTVAISAVAGVQSNLATNQVVRNGVLETEGYIPNIKVFRLTGMDIVRGFNDEEINRVPGDAKDDISEVLIDDRAYLANFKFEPRYFVNDSFMAGVFYDAGRVFVNQFDLGELRDSVGITFKILTPVGTLDFDYGIKLLRERNKDGSLEDPGRFHVSIGFF